MIFKISSSGRSWKFDILLHLFLKFCILIFLLDEYTGKGCCKYFWARFNKSWDSGKRGRTEGKKQKRFPNCELWQFFAVHAHTFAHSTFSGTYITRTCGFCNNLIHSCTCAFCQNSHAHLCCAHTSSTFFHTKILSNHDLSRRSHTICTYITYYILGEIQSCA